jgi:uroporphyrin-III C-methyltransferase / precorrin-2 dehydrogenase / sirohydrochlorin ferrochelatase
MEFLPIFLNLRDQLALVVGGGEVAVRKVALLREAGARVRVVSPALAAPLAAEAAAAAIEFHQRPFGEGDLADVALVIAATNNAEVNQRVATLARQRRIPVNVVDNPDLGSFIMPSIIDRSPVQIAVSTGGASPVLARLLRARLEAAIPAAYGRLGALVERFRDRVKARFGEVNGRRGFWESVLQGPIAELVFSGQDQQAEAELERALAVGMIDARGEVYLVGGGPGDPDLLTFRALRLMQQADVIVHDRLISAEVLALCRRDAERIYVGKERDNHTVPQEEINQLLVDLARQGRRVCRLKGGDPFIFGRGGEEIETLTENGITFQVVPGITAALGSSAYAGIPLTHRDYSQAVTFVTGHLKDGTTNLNWHALAQPNQTVVFYMGLKGLPEITRQLMAHGMVATMPVALVQQATTPRQRVFTATLATINEILAHETIKPPTLIIVGEVVKLHERLRWFRSPAMITHGER